MTGVPCRTRGSVLGLHRVVVGASVDLANSGGIVGMIALGTTWRLVAVGGATFRLWLFATFAGLCQRRDVLLRFGFRRGL